MLCTYLYVNITNKINNKRGEGEGGHIVSPLPSLPPPPPWCSRWCWRYHWCWRCACAHPPSHAHALPHACALPLTRSPSLSCARPPSRALALPRVHPPSPLHLVHPPSLSLMHAPILSCARLPSRSRAPARALVLVCLPALSFSLLCWWWWCCYCSSHCRRCWRCCSCSSSCCCCRARVRAPSYVPAGPPVCVRLLRACPFFCLCTSIYKSIVSMLIMDLRLTLL